MERGDGGRRMGEETDKAEIHEEGNVCRGNSKNVERTIEHYTEVVNVIERLNCRVADIQFVIPLTINYIL